MKTGTGASSTRCALSHANPKPIHHSDPVSLTLTPAPNRYFTMDTLTTVGYGDMPTLPQHMRLITIVFGLVGVLVIAGQIGVVVDYLAEGARKVFIEKQKLLVGEARRVTASINDNARSTAVHTEHGRSSCPSRLRTGTRRLRQACDT